MTKTKFIEHVKGLGDVYRSYANFAQQIKDFNEDGIKSPLSVRDASVLPPLDQDYTFIFGEYTRTCHAPVCAKDSLTIVARMSPLIKDLVMAEQALNAHRKAKYPVFDNDKHIYSKYEEIAKKDESKSPEKRRAIILPERGNYGIHRDSDEARFFWQDTRKNYFDEFVFGGSVPCLQISTKDIDSATGTIINCIGFYWSDLSSGLYFAYRDLDDDAWALGVLRKGAEGTSQKILPYTTQRQQRQYIKILDDVMAGRVGTSKLEKVAQFFKQE